MAKKPSKKKPDAPEGVVQVVNFVIGHWKMVTLIPAALGALGYVFVKAWDAHEFINKQLITRPEVVQLHTTQEEEIAENRAAVQYFREAQVYNLNQQIGELRAIADDRRRSRDEREDARRKMQQKEKELDALQRTRK